MMSARLREEARASGWSDHVIDGLHVHHDNGKFHVRVSEGHVSQALNHEYGTPESQPTAAIRRYNNRQEQEEKFLIGRAFHHMRSR